MVTTQVMLMVRVPSTTFLKGQEAGGDAPQQKQKEEEAPIHTVVEQPAQFPRW